MSPWLMSLLLLVGWGAFFWQLRRRWALLAAHSKGDSIGLQAWTLRVWRVVLEGFGQKKLYNYRWAGLSHHLIFLGFLILLLRTLMLWGRGYWPDFQLWWFTPDSRAPWGLGSSYLGLREYASLLVLGGVAYFAYLRTVRRPKRLTLSAEGNLILLLIATMMFADLLYEACGTSLAERYAEPVATTTALEISRLAAAFVLPFEATAGSMSTWLTPGSSALAFLLDACSADALLGLGLLGYVLHVVLVLLFLNLLPNSKHFHIITALPNLFFSGNLPRGVKPPLAPSAEALLERVDQAMQEERLDDARIGVSRIEHFSWKTRLDWFSCTECGRCTEHCPASRTHKLLDPKQLTLALKRQLLAEAPRLLAPRGCAAAGPPKVEHSPVALVPNVVPPEVFWACTTCRACEEQCPVGVSYVDTILGLRQNAVLMQGEAPPELHRVFEGLERQGNPWNFPRTERDAWARDLEVPRLKDTKAVEVLYWVGCAASYDERAKAVARAFVQLMQRAGVSFAILGVEEQCNGDAARRAGNELLFLQLAEQNIARLNAYQAEGRFATIVTTCPHCQSTLRHDYRDFGGVYEVISHVEALERWVREGRLPAPPKLKERVVYHDPCTLARQLGVIDAPRRLLTEALGCESLLPPHHGKHTLCCGAGGAQMWLEEQNKERMNAARGNELLATSAERVVSACPFCLLMLTDGCGKSSVLPKATPRVFDIAELMQQAWGAPTLPPCDVKGNH